MTGMDLGDIGPYVSTLGPAPVRAIESTQTDRARGPMPTVTYDGKTYKLRSRRTVVPDLVGMTEIGALVWLIQNTYPKGTNHRRAAPNLRGLNLEVR